MKTDGGPSPPPARCLLPGCPGPGREVVAVDAHAGGEPGRVIVGGVEDVPGRSFVYDWTLEHVTGYQPRSADGWGPVPKAPGLGIEVDEDRLGECLFEVQADGA